MRPIVAFEHGWLEIGDNRDLAQREADRLAAAEASLPGGCLEWGHRRVKFRQFCGVLRLEDVQFEVLPKLFPHQTAEQQRHTLLTLLARGGELEALDVHAASLGHSESTLLDTFIRHFARLLEQEVRQGMLQDYQETEDNLDQVRGRIDLVRQQRENLARPQRLACRFNELSTDIPVNRLLRTALDLLHTLANNPLLRQYIASLRMRFSHIPALGRHEWAPQGEDLNRMQRRYAPVVDLAHHFLAGQYLDARTGTTRTFSLLFDMNRLFERYTASLLRPEARHAGLRLQEQGPRQYLATDQHGRGRLLMRPDITLLDRTGKPVSILDTKWKLLGGGDPLAALSTGDLYQISSYASAYGCSDVTLCFPEQPGLTSSDTVGLSMHLESRVRLNVRAVPISRQCIGSGSGFIPESVTFKRKQWSR